MTDSLSNYLYEDVCAPISLPPFDNSAVDGFAISTEPGGVTRALRDEIISARAQSLPILAPESAIKVMTGSPLPKNADAVIMQEEVIVKNNMVFLNHLPKRHENIRFMGQDVEKGQLIARKNDPITPALMGLLLGLGIATIKIKKPLTVAIITSGDELVCAGQPLLFGQSYALVGQMLKALCDQMGFSTNFMKHVPDCKNALLHALNEASDADLFLLTGGMSKGDFDFSRQALDDFQVKKIFHRGFWRPGKPLYFGVKNHQHFFGLPGNPVAVFVGFQVFIRAWFLNSVGIRLLSDLPFSFVRADFFKPRGFTFFARANVNKEGALILSGQGSHELQSLAKANALLWLSNDSSVVKTGERVRYLPL